MLCLSATTLAVDCSKVQQAAECLIAIALLGNPPQNIAELWANWVLNLIAEKPHKRLYFQRGFYALSLIQQAL